MHLVCTLLKKDCKMNCFRELFCNNFGQDGTGDPVEILGLPKEKGRFPLPP